MTAERAAVFAECPTFKTWIGCECCVECEVECVNCLVAWMDDEKALADELCTSVVGDGDVYAEVEEGYVDYKSDEGDVLDLPPLLVDSQRPKFWADTSEDVSLQP